MVRFYGASPPRPAAQSLGWLPPRLLRAIRAAGHLFCLLFAFAGPGSAQPHPVAIYEADPIPRYVGDSFHLVLTVRWTGPADALDVPVPRPDPTQGLAFRMLGSETRQDGGESQVSFRWAVDIREPGTVALDDLVSAVAYAPDIPTPLTVRPQAPLRIDIAPRLSPWTRGAAVLGVIALAGSAGLAATVLLRGRARAQAQHATLAATHAAADRDADTLADAVRRRSEGDYATYLERLLSVVRRDTADEALVADLAALHERVAFAGYRPTMHELERAESGVRRLLDTRHTRSPKETT